MFIKYRGNKVPVKRGGACDADTCIFVQYTQVQQIHKYIFFSRMMFDKKKIMLD